MDYSPECLEYYGARLGVKKAKEYCMIEYQPRLCIADVQANVDKPGRYWVEMRDKSTRKSLVWDVSERYLEYLRKDPAVPVCPPTGWL